MGNIYTGIGSREVPEWVKTLERHIGKFLATQGFKLRSGAAEGSDAEFEKGCDEVQGQKEIYLPWRGFNNSESELVVKDKKAFDMAERFHPYWDNLSVGAKKL